MTEEQSNMLYELCLKFRYVDASLAYNQYKLLRDFVESMIEARK